MKKIGIYIHIPFCEKKCVYCDFNSYDNVTEQTVTNYVKAVLMEIKHWKHRLEDYKVETVYFGGGTPTFLKTYHLESILEVLGSLNLDSQCEITVEANPNTLNKNKLVHLYNKGVNRLSMGLQTCNEELLKFLGRTHTFKDFERNFYYAREAGFENISVDLIFGIPGQDLKVWTEDLNKLMEFYPHHVSAYSLKIEKNTPLYKLMKQGKLTPVDDEKDRKMYEIAQKLLNSMGYHHYEISNFALPSKGCRHNLIYWNNNEYIGIGAGAHSYFLNFRFSNTKQPTQYIKRIFAGKNLCVESEKITKDMEMAETMFLGLRLTQGIKKQHFYERFKVDVCEVYGEQIKALKEKGLLQESGSHIKLTPLGLDLANEVFIHFLP